MKAPTQPACPLWPQAQGPPPRSTPPRRAAQRRGVMSLCSFTVGQQPVASRPCRRRLMSQVLALQRAEISNCASHLRQRVDNAIPTTKPPQRNPVQNTHKASSMSSAARGCEWHQRLLITGRELDKRSLSIRPGNLQQGACPGSLYVTQRMKAMHAVILCFDVYCYLMCSMALMSHLQI